MASDQLFIDFILDQLTPAGPVHAKKMFGEYGLYWDDKIFALVCDNRLYVKPTAAGRAYLQDALTEGAPFPGAKPYFLIEEELDDHRWLQQLVRLTVAELPAPKPKKPKRK
ncbi:TfoX/Sxy family protein [Hymenobacter sp. ASUV-10]|uniref:TfoX/Sxy family protein n=1 Tax=Hymenobacter aranciens TaxID=3063996 RepID=A0ABT9BA03_9BACT|nr:TfoX/Sxy family protein [Hymenobacter sp. ASUV-10]MDO7873521.1 TfoX/Sxy family protein [Hymenobacter sp. ASUV-10]